MTKPIVFSNGFAIGVFAVLLREIREKPEMVEAGLTDENLLHILDTYFPYGMSIPPGMQALRQAMVVIRNRLADLILGDFALSTQPLSARNLQRCLQDLIIPSFCDPQVRLGAFYAYQVMAPKHENGLCAFMANCGFQGVSSVIDTYMEQRGLNGPYISRQEGRTARRDAFVASVIGQIQKYEIIPEVMPFGLYESFAANNPDTFVRPVITRPASYLHEYSDEFYSTDEIDEFILDLELRRDNYEAGLGDDEDWSEEAFGELEFWMELKEFSEKYDGRHGIVYNEPGAYAKARLRVDTMTEDLPQEVLDCLDTEQMVTSYIEEANEREIGGVLWFIWE